jgi:large subunit ribosomal protein L4
MISLPVLDMDGKQVSTIEIHPREFGGRVRRQLLHDAVVMYDANRRVGTHSTKRRGEVAGSKRKLYRQKGTGNARVGARRTNKRRGGGTAKGPKLRDYSFELPKQARRLATRMALLSKFQDEQAVVIQGLKLEQPKSKVMAKILKALKLDGASCLITTNGVDQNIYRSSRNLKGVDVLPCQELYARAVLGHQRLLLTDDALEALRAAARQHTTAMQTA